MQTLSMLLTPLLLLIPLPEQQGNRTTRIKNGKGSNLLLGLMKITPFNNLQKVPLPCPCHIFSDFIALYNTSQETTISELCHSLWGCSCLYTISRGKMSSFRCFTLTLDREPEDVLPQLTCMQSSASQCSRLTSLGINSTAEYLLKNTGTALQ